MERNVVVLVGALLLMAAPSVGAQTTPRATSVWLELGVGGGAGGPVDAGLGTSLDLTVQRRGTQLRLRLAGLVDFQGFPDSGDDDAAGELGVLYGRVKSAPHRRASLSAGLALVSFNRCPGRGSDPCTTVGVPILAEASLDARVVGLGLQAWADLNPRAPFAGLGVVVQAGWLR